MKLIKLWVTQEQMRAEGRERGMAALLLAFKNKDLIPSTVPQEMLKSKEELYGYQEYYTDQWQTE